MKRNMSTAKASLVLGTFSLVGILTGGLGFVVPTTIFYYNAYKKADL